MFLEGTDISILGCVSIGHEQTELTGEPGWHASWSLTDVERRSLRSQRPSTIPMSSPEPNCTLIAPNPDISGIGVRSAIYAQAVLTLVQPILASLDGNISKDELTSLHQLYLGILLPGCALVFAAIIQARTYGLSVYHAIIVLNLSWINNTSALIFFQFALIAQIKFDNERDSRNKVLVMLKLLYKWLGSQLGETLDDDESRNQITSVAASQAAKMRTALQSGLDSGVFQGSKETIEDVIRKLTALLAAAPGNNPLELIELVRTESAQLPEDSDLAPKMQKAEVAGIGNYLSTATNKVVVLLQRDWIMAALASAHLILFAAFGLWLWFTLHQFGDCESRTNFTTLSIFVPIVLTSGPLHNVSIVIYIISILPFINIVFFGLLEFAVIYGCRQLIALIRPSMENPSPKSPKPTSLLESPGRPELYHFVALTFLVQAYFIITTELTIHNNRHLLQKQDSQEKEWTFGQTLAIALIALPLVQVWTEARKKENVEIFKGWFNNLGRLLGFGPSQS